MTLFGKYRFYIRNPCSSILLLLALACLLTGVAQAKQSCSGPPQHRPDYCTDEGEPPPGEITLAIRYLFGPERAAALTEIQATGTLECGSHFCDFSSTTIENSADFLLSADLIALLSEVAWRGTDLEPDQCFGLNDPKMTIDKVTLRRFKDNETEWHAAVHGTAGGTGGPAPRQYVFNFFGCSNTGCVFGDPESGVSGAYDAGALNSIWSNGPDHKFGNVPCRCTRSSTPDCPDEAASLAGLDVPPIIIVVTEFEPE